MKREYFGTDGVRGRVGEAPITPELVMKLGWAAGRTFAADPRRPAGRPAVLIGKDTRISGYLLEAALEAGLSAAGVDVALCGPLPTPGIAYMTKRFECDFGVVISASHNLYDDNGIKFFDENGSKLSDELEQQIESYLDEPALTFWLLLGVASGWGAQYLPPRRTTTRVAAVLTLLVAASVPLQVLHQRAAFDLEHRGIGLSPWQTAIDGVRYRLAAAKSSVFVPASAQMVIIPLRSVALAPEVKVELSLDGRPADVVTIVSDRWHYLRLQMTRDAGGPRFRRLDLRVTPDSGDASVLMVGKVEPR